MIDSVSDSAGAAADLKKAGRQKSARADARPNVDRLPPHWIEGEMGVLGCQLLAPNECVPEVMEKIRGAGSEVHYDLRHQVVQAEIFEMFDARIPVGLIEIQQRLKEKNLLEQVGGIGYLSQLQDSVPSAANLSYWLDKVVEKHLLRKMIQTCTEVVWRVYDYEGEVDTLMDEVERDILAIRPQKTSGETDIKVLCRQAIDSFETLFQSKGAIRGLSTGLPDLDKKSDGMHAGEMIVIAAYPSCGKSTLAANIAAHNALLGNGVLIYSAEMNPVAIVMRAICSEARVNLYDVRDGIASESDFTKISTQISRISGSKLHVVNAGGWTVNQIAGHARRYHQRHGIKLIVVDYLQRISCVDKKIQNREQEVSAMSNRIKNMAMELNVPVLCLSQLNDDGKLRESRAIGQDGDSVWIINNDGDRQPKEQPVILSIEKCRDGEIGPVPLLFRKTITRFESATISDADVPEGR